MLFYLTFKHWKVYVDGFSSHQLDYCFLVCGTTEHTVQAVVHLAPCGHEVLEDLHTARHVRRSTRDSGLSTISLTAARTLRRSVPGVCFHSCSIFSDSLINLAIVPCRDFFLIAF